MPERAKVWRPPGQEKSPSERARGNRHQRGYTSRWSRFSKQMLRERPLCEVCLEMTPPRYTASQCSDHIDGKGPLSERGFDPTNIKVMCIRCHSKKTCREDGGFGLPKPGEGE